MANHLKREKKIDIVKLLVEGNSIRSIERLTRVNRDTICYLLVKVGNHCQQILDEMMQGVKCEAIQLDEVWGFVQKKQARLTADDPIDFGDQYTFIAMDRKTKVVPCFRVGKRNEETTWAFVNDLARRIEGQTQLSSDAYRPYKNAIARNFKTLPDYGRIIKAYGLAPERVRNYNPAKLSKIIKAPVFGDMHPDDICTSHVERGNLTARMHCRRLTRLTNAFSKKLDNLKAAMALHFAWYNLVRVHRSLRTSPAVAAGVANHIWDIGELVP